MTHADLGLAAGGVGTSGSGATSSPSTGASWLTETPDETAGPYPGGGPPTGG